jgi:hypothetical protein
MKNPVEMEEEKTYVKNNLHITQTGTTSVADKLYKKKDCFMKD